MGSMFGKHKHSHKITEQDEAILQLKQQRDKLNQMNRRIEQQITNEHDLAKRLAVSGKKKKALLLLKKKKYLEKNVEKANAHLNTIQNLIDEIEFAEIQVKVLDGLKVGNDALKSLHQVYSLADAERIMSDAEDSVAYQRELDDIVSRGLTSVDTDELEQELEKLTGAKDLNFPQVPMHTLPERDLEPKGSRQTTNKSIKRIALES